MTTNTTTRTATAIPATWTENDGIYEHQSGTAVVTTQGKRWIAVINGCTLTGESGGTRFFGTAAAAITAAEAVLPEELRAPVAEVLAEEEQPEEVPAEAAEPAADATAEGEAKPKKERKPKAPKKEKAEQPRDLAGIIAADEELDAALAEAGWGREGIESGRLEGPQGIIEVTGERGSFVVKKSNGEYLTGPAGGKRLFKWPSAAIRTLVKSAA